MTTTTWTKDQGVGVGTIKVNSNFKVNDPNVKVNESGAAVTPFIENTTN